MTSTPRGYKIEFNGNDIVFSGFVSMQVEGRAEYQDGAWLLMVGSKSREVGYADSLQEVMEWANNDFGIFEDEA